MHVNTTICVDKGGEGERARHVIGLGRERNVERDNREASVRESPFISFWRLQRQ